VVINTEPKYTFSLTTTQNKINFNPLFKVFGNGIYDFVLPYVNHKIVIMKSGKRFKFFEANAGAISCKSEKSFHIIFNEYFMHSTMWTKYSRTRSLPVDAQGEVIKTTTSIKFDLMTVFVKKTKKEKEEVKKEK